jgi:hypothetical protein
MDKTEQLYLKFKEAVLKDSTKKQILFKLPIEEKIPRGFPTGNLLMKNENTQWILYSKENILRWLFETLIAKEKIC